ncbi:hypothetical protein D5H75_29550 [Bailinhaonella thermotolerans]|uniref:Uncharacterized protein n=1 Tax=Bailinhaonella thermotolerans TaxID=1070861 RepID=A0A3A4ASY5_9ACTN|nr:hypothetical protein D5H75_29550 [Bailinhaonella thermotolerans]
MLLGPWLLAGTAHADAAHTSSAGVYTCETVSLNLSEGKGNRCSGSPGLPRFGPIHTAFELRGTGTARLRCGGGAPTGAAVLPAEVRGRDCAWI